MHASEEEQAHHAHLRAIGEFVKGKHDKRPWWGQLLAKSNFDEIAGTAIHLLTGDLKVFAKARPVMAEEMVGKPLLEACADQNHAPIDVSRNMESGVANEIALTGGRVMDTIGWPKWVRATMKPAHELSSKSSRLKATFSRDFLTQTSSSEADDSPKQRRRTSDRPLRRHAPARKRAFTRKFRQERVG